MQNIKIHEVGLRDGLQMEAKVVPTELKLEWIKLLLQSGVDIIQLGSFVHPGYVPQMADTDALFKIVKTMANETNTALSALVLNEKGFERGMACGVDMFCLGVSASETHSQKNTRMSISEATERILNIASLARDEGKLVQLSVQSAFGCGFEGKIDQHKVIALVDKYLESGFYNISLADTAGHANPESVKELVTKVLELSPEIDLTGHFHNTYGMGIANCYAAIESGVHTLECSFAGLGGCPYTKVAGGNVCSEDLIYMLKQMGNCSDINIDPFLAIAKQAAGFLSKDLPGMLYKI